MVYLTGYGLVGALCCLLARWASNDYADAGEHIHNLDAPKWVIALMLDLGTSLLWPWFLVSALRQLCRRLREARQ